MSADPNAEHPGYDIRTGIRYQQRFITALQQSPYWSSSAYILTWDEGGGGKRYGPPAPPRDGLAATGNLLACFNGI